MSYNSLWWQQAAVQVRVEKRNLNQTNQGRLQVLVKHERRAGDAPLWPPGTPRDPQGPGHKVLLLKK